MKFASPIVIFIIVLATVVIFTKMAKKLFFHWLILLVILIGIFVIYPKSIELLANFVSVIRAVIFKI